MATFISVDRLNFDLISSSRRRAIAAKEEAKKQLVSRQKISCSDDNRNLSNCAPPSRCGNEPQNNDEDLRGGGWSGAHFHRGRRRARARGQRAPLANAREQKHARKMLLCSDSRHTLARPQSHAIETCARAMRALARNPRHRARFNQRSPLPPPPPTLNAVAIASLTETTNPPPTQPTPLPLALVFVNFRRQSQISRALSSPSLSSRARRSRSSAPRARFSSSIDRACTRRARRVQ